MSKNRSLKRRDVAYNAFFTPNEVLLLEDFHDSKDDE